MSGPGPTPQQAAALAARCSPVVLGAGAGCGKTTVLVRRFLDQIDPAIGGSPLERVVAITFTRAAAAEMRARLRAGCRERLEAATGPAAAAWREILGGLESARVSTIHGFCGRLLRSFAVEAGVDPAFGELEPDVAARRRRTATVRYLRDGLLAKDADCDRFVELFGYRDACERLTELAARRDGPGATMPDAFGDLSEDRADDVAALWAEEEASAVPARVAAFLAGPEVTAVRSVLAEASAGETAKARSREVLIALDELEMAVERHEAADRFRELVAALKDAAKVQGAGVKAGFGDAYDAVRDAFKALRDEGIRSLAAQLGSGGDAAETLREAASMSLLAARLTAAVDREFEKQLRAAGLVAIDELIGRAGRLLDEHPSVRRRVAGGIDLLMVDEFQDTDPAQASLIESIRTADVASPPRLFVVGDHQQSIYRFRKADPTVFRDLRETAPPAGRLVLSENFRSRGEILAFVNHLFAEGMEGGYERLSPGTPSPPLEPDDAINENTPRAVEWIATRADGNADARRDAEATTVARRLRAILADGVPRIRQRSDDGEVTLRPVAVGDVCVLCRTHAGFKAYERAFEAAGLPYHVVGGKAFYAQQEVLDVAMLCGWLADAGDTASLVGVLRSPMFGIDDETLLALKVDRGSIPNGLFEGPPPDGLHEGQGDRILFARAVLSELRERKDDLPARAVLRLAFERTGYDASLLFEFLGRRKLANVEKLLEIAAAVDAAEDAPLATLAATLRDAVLEEPNEALATVQGKGSGAATFMTVHQSKGLEFPLVVVADMEWRPQSGRGSAAWSRTLGPLLKLPADEGEGDGDGKHPAWNLHVAAEEAGDEAETLRLLYVAATRAEDRLLLAAGLEGGKPPRSPWLKQLVSRFDLTEGRPLDSEDDEAAFAVVSPGGPAAERVEEAAEHDARVPLDRLRDLVAAAEAVGPGYLPAVRADRDGFSVTELAERLAASRSGPAAGPASADARAFGIAVHAALERMPRDAARRDAWIAKAESTGDLSLGRREELASILRTFAASEVAGETACNRVDREVDLAIAWDARDEAGRVVFGQIDALIDRGGGAWHVIDYKVPASDFSEGERDDALLGRYSPQLALYAIGVHAAVTGKAVAEAVGDGGVTVTAELVVLGSTVRRLPVDVSPASLAAWLPRIEAVLREAASEGLGDG